MSQINFLTAESFKIIELLIGTKYYLREIAEKTKYAPSTVFKIVSLLSSKKILFSKKNKNRKFFSLNYNSPLTTNALKIISINKIITTKAFVKLTKLNPIGIYLFGSSANGKMTENSDIDLAIYFETQPNSILLSTIKRELSNELKKEIQLIILTKNKINSMQKNNVELLNQIKNNSIILEGKELE